jgi:ankyrin repeat protein
MDDLDQDSSIVKAALNGDFSRVEFLIDQGVNIDNVDSSGRTAVLAATQNNHVPIVKLLVKSGANINLSKTPNSITDNTPFLHAGANGLDEILDILIPLNPDVNILNKYGGNALIPACEKGHLSTVIKLLEQTDVDVNLVNKLGWTALLEAIILSDGGTTHQQIIKVLLNHGADASINDLDGISPIEHARKKGFREIVKILEEHAREGKF